MSSTEPVGSSPDGWQAWQPVPGSTAKNTGRAAQPNRTTGPLCGLESLQTDTTRSGHSAAVSWAPVQSQSQDFDSVIREFAGQILANPPPGDIWPALASLVPKLSDRDRILEVATGLESEDDKRVVLTLLAHQASYFTPAQLDRLIDAVVLIDPRYDSRPLDALVSQMHHLNGEQCARLIKHTVAYVEPLRDFVLGSPTLVALAANPDQLTAAHHEEIVDAVLGAKGDDCQAVAIACLASGTFPLDSYHERIVNALRKFSMQSAKCTAVIGLAPTLSASSTALNELLVDFAINMPYPDMRSAAIVALAARMSALGEALGMSLVDATMDLPEDLKAPAIAALGDQVDVLGSAQGDRLVDAAYGLRDEGELATALTGLVRGEEFMSERARERVVRLWMRLTDDKLKAEVLAAYC